MSKEPIDKLYYVFGFGNHLTFSRRLPFVKSKNPKRFTSRESFPTRTDQYTPSLQNMISLRTNFDFDNITIVRTNDFVNTFVQIPKRIFTRDMPYRGNEEMYNAVKHILRDLVNPNIGNVFVVGHSAGGALVNHLAKKINDIFAGKNIKIQKHISIKTTRLPRIRKTVRARLSDFTYKDSKSGRIITLQKEDLKKLHIASFGAIWVWGKHDATPSVEIHNYLSRTDISNFCVGKNVCNTLMSNSKLRKLQKSIDENNNDRQFDGVFSITRAPNLLWNETDHYFYNSELIDHPQILCSCFYNNPNSTIIPICLYNKNKSACNYTSFLDGYGEHNYYDPFMNTLLLNRELNIYEYKDATNESGAVLTQRETPAQGSPLRSKVKTDYS